MATSFDNKCKILSQVWVNFKDDEGLADFIKYNDVSLPLAYFIDNEIVTDISEKAENFIEETWSLLESAFDLHPDSEWESLEEIFEYLEDEQKEEGNNGN